MPDAAQEIPGRPEDFIVVIRLQGWEEAQNLPDRLALWYNYVMSNVYQYLKSAHAIEPTFKSVFVAVDVPEERRKALGEIFGKLNRNIKVMKMEDEHGPRGYRIACLLAFRQAILYRRDRTVSYVLVTNDVDWDTEAFWRKMSLTSEEGHMIKYRSVSGTHPSEGNKHSIAEVFDPIYLKEPDICWYFPDRKAMATSKGDPYLSADEKDLQTGATPCRCRVPVEKDAGSREDNDSDVASAFESTLNLDDLD